ncbi:unnamed protein product [Pylaiella littoralis]
MMAHFPLLLRLVVVSCFACLQTASFAPAGSSSTAVFFQNRQRECAASPTSAPLFEHKRQQLHQQLLQRRRTLLMSSRHRSPRSRGIERSCRQRRHSSSSTEVRAAEGGGASDRAEFLERVAAGTFAAAAAAVGVRPEEAGAFCGEPYPYWAYFMDFDEVFVPFKFEGYTGSLFARTVGFVKEQQKAQHNSLVVIPGGPGLPHDYLETLEGAAKDDRVVILFDPIGTGNSTALPADVAANAPGLLGTASLIAQTNAVVDYFKVNTYHLLGHGTAAEAALEIGRRIGKASPRPPGPELEAVLSVTLASPVLGDNELSADFLDTLRAPYTKGGNEPPLCLETAMAGRNADGFTGGLAIMKQERRSKSGAATGPLSCPVLITYGKRDVIGDKAVASIEAGLSGGDAPVEVKRFDNSGHLPHLDEREEYVALVQNYVTSIDNTWAGKSGETKK